MKKHILWFALIILIAFAITYCTNSGTGPTPDFKYLGTWVGLNSLNDSVEFHVENVSNKQMITYLKLIGSTRLDSFRWELYISGGITEVEDSTFSYTKVSPVLWDSTIVTTTTIDGVFESETNLSGSFIRYVTNDPDTIQGTFLIPKQ